QFECEAALVVSAFGDLRAPAGGRARGHDNWYRGVPRSPRARARPNAAATIPRRGRRLPARNAGGGSMKLAPFFLRLIERLRGSFAWIEATELKRRLNHGEAMTIVDVRGPDEFTGSLGHIASARKIPVAELAHRLPELAGRERESVVLVCRTDKRSASAARTLRAAGFARVSVLRRGMEQWNETGYAVDRRAAEATSKTSATEHTA